MAGTSSPLLPRQAEAPHELDFSSVTSDDFEALSRDKVPVRSMEERDLAMIIDIDRRITGTPRAAYFRQKLDEALHESDVRVSLVAESDGYVAGFIMARVDFGDYGRIEPEAVIDTIGVDPESARKGIGRALLSQLVANLSALRVERVRTHVAWNDLALLGFLDSAGFRPAQRLVLSRRLGARVP
jgi:ribosomal protein S18 acetylase RimI-like enzyme